MFSYHLFKTLEDEIKNTTQKFSTREFKYESRRVTWMEAEAECIKWGGHLLTINSQQENAYFVKAIAERISGDSVCIGLNDIRQEGHFVWVSGKQGLFNDNWDKGEPNGGRRENCVMMYLTGQKNGLAGKWNDFCCDGYKQGFVCERDRPR